jgi:tetratricopeptide (TPR) repeat protein
LQNDLLAKASPESEADRDIKLRTVLDRAAKTIDGRFPAQPLVEASIRETLAWTYDALGDQAVASGQATKAIALYAREKGPEVPEVLRLRYFEAFADMAKGKLAEAENLATHVLAIQRRDLPASNPDIYATWQLLIQIYDQAGKPDRAMMAAREALAAATKNLGPDHGETIKLEYILGRSLSDLQQRECLEVYRHCLEKARRVLGNEHSLTLLVLSDLAVALGNRGEVDEYLALSREVLAIKTRVLGRKHPDTAATLINLATALSNQGKLKEAEEFFEEGRATNVQLFGREDRRTLRADTNLIQHWFRLGKYREGTELGAKNLAIYERLLGPEHPDTRVLKLFLCPGYLGLGEFETVIALAQPLVDLSRRDHAPTSAYTTATELMLASADRDLGHFGTAEELYRGVESAVAASVSDASGATLQAERFAFQLRICEGDFAAAETSARRAVESHERHYGPTDQATLLCKIDLARLLLRRNAAPEAEKILREITELRERDAGLDALPTLSGLDALGIVLGLEGHWTEAEATLRRSGEHWGTLEPGGWREALNRISLGWVLYAGGHHSEAASLLDAGYTTVKNPAKFAPGERLIRSVVVARIAAAYRESGDVEASAKWQALTSP